MNRNWEIVDDKSSDGTSIQHESSYKQVTIHNANTKKKTSITRPVVFPSFDLQTHEPKKGKTILPTNLNWQSTNERCRMYCVRPGAVPPVLNQAANLVVV